jgi:kynurenine 3-monooxygenase
MTKRVTVIGGGPVGATLACMLAKRGFAVEIYERRPDMRSDQAAGGRSINLVLTTRGLRALKDLGLFDEVMALTAPVAGRQMHALDGALTYQAYGKTGECNHSISRGELNKFLLTKAEAAGASIRFECPLVDADFEAGTATFESKGERFSVETELLIGCDGAPSALRAAMVQRAGCEASVDMLSHGYKELTFPAAPGGGFAMREDALHIWPRGDHMLMGLPNPDGSFTGTLYLARTGEQSFESLTSAEDVVAFFETHYPDSVALLPGLGESFMSTPMGELGTVRSFPWNVGGRALLVGDSAHGIVPFFGQGLNCGFEDCVVLAQLLDEQDDMEIVFTAYAASRKTNTDAIADMALANFVEMRDSVGDPAWLLRKGVQGALEKAFPTRYRSRYAMVMYSYIPYRHAFDAGLIHGIILDELCEGLDDPESVDLERASALIDERLKPFLDANDIDLEF